MTELTQSLKLAVTRYPGTMAELARRAAIDRSTLYKIVSGQRTPRQEQVERLADALELNEEQKTALLTQYKRRGRSTDPKIRAELHRLLEAAFRVQDYTRREGVISNEAAQETSWTPRYVEGARAVEAAVGALVARHLLSGETRPLLLSPFTNPVLDKALLDRFSAAEGAPVHVSQLLIFAANSDIPREWVSDVSALTRTLPLLFLPKVNYEARVVRCALTEPSPGTLMPVYLLLPEAAVMMDRQGQKAFFITDKEAVGNLRLSFSRKYIDGSSVLKLATSSHDFSESMALYGRLFAKKRRCSMLRYQPPFTLFADREMALRVVRQDAAAAPMLPLWLDYLNGWSQQTPDLYFCEEGILQFVRTGRMFDLPPDLYNPPDVEMRRELLRRLYKAAASDRQTVRIVDAAQLPMTPTMSVNVFQGSGVVFCQAVLEPGKMYCREYLMEDPVLTDALLGYLDEDKASAQMRSQKYTLDFIDYCLRLL